MTTPDVDSIAEVVIANPRDPEAAIQQLWSWHYEHDMTIAKGLFGLAGSLLLATLVGALDIGKELVRENRNISEVMVHIPLTSIQIPMLLATLVAAAVVAFAALFWLLRAAWVSRLYIDSLSIHSRLMRIRPFLLYLRFRGRM